MKKKLCIIIPIVAVLLIGGVLAFYFFYPISFKDGVGNIKTEDISKIQLIKGDGYQLEITDSAQIKDIYDKIADVKLKPQIPENRTGWSYGLKIYQKASDGFVFYVTNSGFTKQNNYKGSVKESLNYIDTTGEIEQTIKNYFENFANEIQPIESIQ